MLDEVINMLAAVRDAAAADTYNALLPSNGADNTSGIEISTPKHHPSTVKTSDHQQQQQSQKQQRHRGPLPRPASVASIDLRDPDEI